MTEAPMRYLIMALEDDGAFAARSDPDAGGAYWSSWTAYIQALQDAGVLVDAAGLETPVASTTVRVRDGRTVVQDGPFTDSKEHMGGYFVVEVPDLDAALTWAARCPSAAYASVEVRPLLERPM